MTNRKISEFPVMPDPSGNEDLYITDGTSDLRIKLSTILNMSSMGLVTLYDLGLENVDNTTDLNKPISLLIQEELDKYIITEEFNDLLDTKADTDHTHPISDVLTLQDTLDDKIDISDLDTKSLVAHTHPIEEVFLLQYALDNKSPTIHTHEGLVSGPHVYVDGILRVPVDSLTWYTITNFDSFTTYDITAVEGVVTEYQYGSISYQAPSTPGMFGFTVNDKVVAIEVFTVTVLRPTITYPDQYTEAPVSFAAICTGFLLDELGFILTEYNYTEWQLATDSGFTNIIDTFNVSPPGLADWSISGLSSSTTYYMRVRHVSFSYGMSPWSDTRVINTAASILPTKEMFKIVPIDAPYEFAGEVVAISGNGSTIAIAAPQNSGYRGKVYIYVKGTGVTWYEQYQLVATDGVSFDSFGCSIALSENGNTIIIGAMDDDGGMGSAYIFIRAGTVWAQLTKLTASDRGSSDRFGISVAISGDGNTVAVGAYEDETDGTIRHGSVYVFVKGMFSVWSQQTKLLPDTLTNYHNFGVSVSLTAWEGDTLVIGSYREAVIYIYTRSGTIWTKQARIINPDSPIGNNFGSCVVISGDGNTIAVSDPEKVISSKISAGAVYIFKKSGSTWEYKYRLTCSTQSDYDRLGGSLGIDYIGSSLIAGASSKDDTPNDNAGAVYIFSLAASSGAEEAVVRASDKAWNDAFGSCVALSHSGSIMVAGSTYDDTINTNHGSAYVFTN